MTENPGIRLLINGPLHVVMSLILVGLLWFLISNVPMDEELVKQGNGFQQVGQSDLAQKSYETALEYNPDNAEARFQMGVVFSQLGNTNSALALFDEIDAQALAYPARIDIQRGWIFYYRGDVESAERHFYDAMEAIQQNPAGYTPEVIGSAYSGLGWATYLNEGCDAAEIFFRRAIEAVPNSSSAQRGYEACNE